MPYQSIKTVPLAWCVPRYAVVIAMPTLGTYLMTAPSLQAYATALTRHPCALSPVKMWNRVNKSDNHTMKFLFDLFPVILFFVAFKFADIYTATIVAMIATIAQILWVYYRHRKIDAMQWMSLVLIVVLGALTILLQDKTFIQLKPTALYWLFAAGLFISAQFFNKNWIQVLMGKQVTLKENTARNTWSQLNLAWSIFFFLMGALNLYVAFQFSEDTWVNFKLFGTTALLIVFVIAQGFWLSKHMEEETPS
jgi:intracellular septation protein